MSEKAKQVSQVHINADVETVWKTLTKRGEVLPFFFGSVMHTTELAEGAPMHMRTPNGKYTGVVGKILEFDPPRKLSHTFRFTNYDDADCVVTYELKESAEGGTEFTLTSSQIPVGTKTEKQMKQGGPFIANTLKGVVENGRPPFGARMILTMIRLTAPLTPKKCLADRWPLESKSQHA